MSTRQFRFLLIASIVLGILGPCVDLVFPALLSEDFQRAQEAQDSAQSLPRLLFIAGFGLILLVTLVATVYGLYKFRPWAPCLSLLTTVLGLIIWPASGALAQSGWAISASLVASYLWGAVLVLSLFPPFNAHFRRTEG